MIKPKHIRLLPVFCCSAVLLSGCSTPKPEFLHNPFEADKVGRIAVLPFIDGREHPDPEGRFKDLEVLAASSVIQYIKFYRRYRAFDTTDIGDVSEYTAHVIEPSKGQYAPPDYVKQLGPTQAKWVLVPVCNDLGRYNVLLSAGGSASVSLYLFNKETGELWWKGAAKGSMSTGGLIGTLIDASGKYGMESICLALCGMGAAKTLPQVKNALTKAGGNWIAQHYSIETASDLQRIAVTSVVDGRRSKRKNATYEPKKFQDKILKILHEKGYDGFAVQGFGQKKDVSQAQVAIADSAFGKSLAGVRTKYVLIPVVNDAMALGMGLWFYELSFYLFNTESGELIWEGSSGGSMGKTMLALDQGDGLPRRKDLMK